ncbi:MAG: Cobalt transport protein [Acidimicrobiales bacterium]|nr:Cobalt transport protein [Acidimicrobiales bacterium]
MRTTSPLHAVTWLLWATAAAASVQLAPSPVYVALVVVICVFVVDAHRLDGTLAKAFPVLVTLGVVFAVLRVVLTTITTHGGPKDDVWFTTPSVVLPRILGGFQVGGSVEGQVVFQSAAQAFAVVGILAAFGAFNAVAAHHEVLQAAPRAFHEPGLIVTVALAFVPSTMVAVAAAREADRARTGGRVVRRGRLVRLTVPIVESGLERAMALAESMDARGFARTAPGRADRVAGWLGLGSMLALGGSFLALIGESSTWAIAAATAGTGGLVAAIVLASRSTPAGRYRPRHATRLDVTIGLASLLGPAGLVVAGALGDHTMAWSASPIRFPDFSLLAALSIATLAVPLLVSPHRVEDAGTDPAVALAMGVGS